VERQQQSLALTLHHLITDGWSSEVLVRELSVLYRAYHAEQPAPLAPLPIQYADYAIWQRTWLHGERQLQHIGYWRQQLRGAAPLVLPTDVPRGTAAWEVGARYRFTLPAELSREIAALSRREGTTVFMTLLAAFQILLYRISGQSDIVVGTDVANRRQIETEGLIGFFVNLVALRTQIQRSMSFRLMLQQVRAMALEAYAHQELPFELVVEHVSQGRQEQQTPLVQVLCVMQNTPRSLFSLPEVELELIEREEAMARFDLALFLREEASGITGSVVYRAGLFQAQTIASWMQQFEVLLGSIVAQQEKAIDLLDIWTDEQKVARAREKAAKGHLKAKRIREIRGKGVEIGEHSEDWSS
jgi:hypothetical protein